MQGMDSYADLFEADPDWTAYAQEHGYLKDTTTSPSPTEIDVTAARAEQRVVEGQWAIEHPLESVGYTSRSATAKVRDGGQVNVKLSFPSRLGTTPSSGSIEKLPILFNTHGGGFFKGTHITEEAWLLWPLYKSFSLAVISVEYRLAPECPPPTWTNDSFDVLEQLTTSPSAFLHLFIPPSQQHFQLDTNCLILAGSSAGAAITASLSQICRSHSPLIPVYGVVLNVPVLCDYRHLPSTITSKPDNSYAQCTHTLLSANDMRAVWSLAVPSANLGSEPLISPLLGDLRGLPKQMIFIAGQDPLRDEGLLYAERLREAGVEVKVEVYRGVPHTFSEIWELEATKRFWGDIAEGLGSWLR
jgi:acetyl esterase